MEMLTIVSVPSLGAAFMFNEQTARYDRLLVATPTRFRSI